MDFLRGAAARQVRSLAELLAGEEIVGIAPIILQEVLQGADSEERFEKWRRTFGDIRCYVAADPVQTHIAAARLYQTCRRAGKTPRSSNDCLVAQIAIEHELALLHNDCDFEAIASAVPELRLHPLTQTAP